MWLLLSGATSVYRDFPHAPIAPLVTPRGRNSPQAVHALGRGWAADNDCFSGFNELAFLTMLERFQGTPNCHFVSAPDVVADATATQVLFEDWEPRIHAYGLPVALVAQDGLTDPPWSRFEALFIGGSTEWKLGLEAATLIREAKARGKWVHMGRVNSAKRARYAQRLGVDSFDGSGFSRWPRKNIPPVLPVICQPLLFPAQEI